VPDITRLILRLALWVTTSGDAKSFPTILSNLLQVLILHLFHSAQKQKSALEALFLNLVGRAGFEPATN
jgi:hypothetical protein